MNKYIISSIFVATIALSPMVTIASPKEKILDAEKITTPGISEAISSALPNTGDSGSTADDWSDVIIKTVDVPPVSNSGSSATPPTSESSSTATPHSPTPTPTPTTNISSSSGSRVNYVYFSGCPLITSYMRYGANNDTAQVTKLQTFLKNVEKIDVDINGIFDKKTEDAVKTFQNKYPETVMGPWGASTGTGIVYITTLKQINKNACNIPLSVNESELAIITARKNQTNSTNTEVIVTATQPATTSAVIENGSSVVDDTSEGNTENTATVTKSSVINRFWNFVKYLFK